MQLGQQCSSMSSLSVLSLITNRKDAILLYYVLYQCRPTKSPACRHITKISRISGLSTNKILITNA